MRAWRVEYKQNSGYVFCPRGRLEDETTINQLRGRHLAWERGFASPFLSVFTDKAHAIHWGRLRDAYCVHEIKTDGLDFIHGGIHELLIIGPIPSANHVRKICQYDYSSELRDYYNRRDEAQARAEAQRKQFFHPDTGKWYECEEDSWSDVDELSLIEYFQNH